MCEESKRLIVGCEKYLLRQGERSQEVRVNMSWIMNACSDSGSLLCVNLLFSSTLCSFIIHYHYPMKAENALWNNFEKGQQLC